MSVAAQPDCELPEPQLDQHEGQRQKIPPRTTSWEQRRWENISHPHHLLRVVVGDLQCGSLSVLQVCSGLFFKPSTKPCSWSDVLRSRQPPFFTKNAISAISNRRSLAHGRWFPTPGGQWLEQAQGRGRSSLRVLGGMLKSTFYHLPLIQWPFKEVIQWNSSNRSCWDSWKREITRRQGWFLRSTVLLAHWFISNREQQRWSWMQLSSLSLTLNFGADKNTLAPPAVGQQFLMLGLHFGHYFLREDSAWKFSSQRANKFQQEQKYQIPASSEQIHLFTPVLSEKPFFFPLFPTHFNCCL